MGCFLIAKITGKSVTLALTGKAELFNSTESFRNRLFGSCNHYIATTHEIRDSFITDAHIDVDKISIIPHGINTNLYPYVTPINKENHKLAVGLNKNIPVLLFCARVAKNKGILLALEVWKRLHSLYPNAKFYIVGGGENTLLDEARRVSHDCNDSIIITGEVDNVAEYHAISDVYIFLSEHEGLPTSLLEAMSSGLATVNSNIGGNDDLIFDDITWYRVPVHDVEQYVKCISELFDKRLL